jgi:hypothetical protein
VFRWARAVRRLAAAGSAALAVGFTAVPIDAVQAAQVSTTFGVGITILPADAQASLPPVDLFAASAWHAVDGPWPGTVRFDGRTHTVHLDLVGAQPVDAAYSYAVEQAPAGRHAAGQHGRLHIAPMNGLAIDLAFVLSNDGKNLTLVFERGAIAQHYVRMAPEDQVRERNLPQTVMTPK